jgi:hypothetical protein
MAELLLGQSHPLALSEGLMRKFSRLEVVLAFMLGVVIASAGTATASKLITGKQIMNGSITEKDLSKDLRSEINKGPALPGPKGDTGARGETGLQGAPGVPVSPGQATVTNIANPLNQFAYYEDCATTFNKFCVDAPAGTPDISTHSYWGQEDNLDLHRPKIIVEPDGMLQLQGLAKFRSAVHVAGTVVELPLFRLPPALRPSGNLYFPAIAYAGGPDSDGGIAVAATGYVYVISLTINGGSTATIDMSNVRFLPGALAGN